MKFSRKTGGFYMATLVYRRVRSWDGIMEGVLFSDFQIQEKGPTKKQGCTLREREENMKVFSVFSQFLEGCFSFIPKIGGGDVHVFWNVVVFSNCWVGKGKSTFLVSRKGGFPPNPFGLRYLGGHYMIQYLGVENDLCWGLNSHCCEWMVRMVINLRVLYTN